MTVYDFNVFELKTTFRIKGILVFNIVKSFDTDDQYEDGGHWFYDFDLGNKEGKESYGRVTCDTLKELKQVIKERYVNDPDLFFN